MKYSTFFTLLILSLFLIPSSIKAQVIPVSVPDVVPVSVPVSTPAPTAPTTPTPTPTPTQTPAPANNTPSNSSPIDVLNTAVTGASNAINQAQDAITGTGSNNTPATPVSTPEPVEIVAPVTTPAPVAVQTPVVTSSPGPVTVSIISGSSGPTAVTTAPANSNPQPTNPVTPTTNDPVATSTATTTPLLTTDVSATPKQQTRLIPILNTAAVVQQNAISDLMTTFFPSDNYGRIGFSRNVTLLMSFIALASLAFGVLMVLGYFQEFVADMKRTLKPIEQRNSVLE